MSCVSCINFEMNRAGGYCSYHGYTTHPQSSCFDEDSSRGGTYSKTCLTCGSYYSKTGGFAYCHRWDRGVDPLSSCPSWR